MADTDAMTVPEIHLTTSSPQMRDEIEAAMRQSFAKHGIASSSDIAHIAEFRTDGVTLKLNLGEGMILFQGNELLDKKWHLFDGARPLTEDRLKEINATLSADGVAVSRQPSLDNGFRALVTRAEECLGNVKITPPASSSLDGMINAHQVTVVGENHLEEAARLIITTKLPQLAETGGALVMEGLPKNRQGMLDAWLKASAHTPVPPLLAASLRAHTGDEMMINRGIPEKNIPPNPDYYSATRLLMDAKNAGVTVYGVDSDEAILMNYSNWKSPPSLLRSAEFTRKDPLDYRVLTMNQEAGEVIDALKKEHPGKILVNVGGAHARLSNGIPGVGDYVGGGQVVVSNGSDFGSKIIPPAEGGYLAITANPAALKQQLLIGSATDVQADSFTLPPALPFRAPPSQEQMR